MSRAALAALVLAAACGPSSKTPVKVMAIVHDKLGNYEPRQVELNTTSDIVAMKGSIATMVGGARVVVDENDPALARAAGDDAKLAAVFVKGPGGDPHASYIEKTGVLWPADFHTWNLVTLYYEFEQAFLYWQAVYNGKPTDDLLGSKIYYFPTFIIAQSSTEPQRDNALWFSPVQSFLVLPFDKLQDVPLAVNLGVVGHEFSHRVFNRKVYGGAALPAPFSRWLGLTASSPQLNVLKSIDEGLADFHGYGVTCVTSGKNDQYGCDPKFFAASLGTTLQEARDFTQGNKCMTKGLRDAMLTQSASDFGAQSNEYKVGTILASALYIGASKHQKLPLLQQSVLNAYNDPDPKNEGIAQLISNNIEQPANFTLERVVDIIAAHITDPELKRDTCSALTDKLRIDCASLPACGATCVQDTTCPAFVQ